jgi:integrase
MGKLAGQKLPLSLKQVAAIRRHLTRAQQFRELVLFNLAIESNLRACDLLQLRVRDVARGGEVAAKVKAGQANMNFPVQFEISAATRESIAAWIAQEGLKPGHYLFPSRLSESPHLSPRQFARIVSSWVSLIGLDPGAYGTQSLRRTKPALAYQKTGNLEAAQQLLGHTKRGTTVRFLGIEDKN